jgi:WD40 repeat protein
MIEKIKLTEEVIKSFTPGCITCDNVGRINSLDISQDGSLVLSASDDDTINIYNTNSTSRDRILFDKPYGPNNAKFTPDKNILYSNRKGKMGIIRYISTYDQTPISTYKEHYSLITSIDISFQNTFISTGKDNCMKLWDIRQQNSVSSFYYPDSAGDGICRFDPSVTIAALTYPSVNSSLIKLIDLRKFYLSYNTWNLDYKKPVGLELSDDGRLMCVSTSENKLLVLDAINGGILKTINDYNNSSGACKASVSPDSNWISIGDETENSIKIFNLNSGDLITTLPGHPRLPSELIWSKHHGLLISACWNILFWVIN